MKQQTSLKAILGVSLVGMLFSGYLSYSELFHQVCNLGGACTAETFAIPSCVYGFAVYLIIFIVSIIGLKSK